MDHSHFDARRPDHKFSLKLGGLHCTSCASTIEKHLSRLGATDARVDFANKTATFSLSDPSKADYIITSIKKLGYSVQGPEQSHHHDRDTALYIKCFISAALTLPMLAGMFLPIHALHEPYLQAVLATPVFIIGIMHFGTSGLRSLRAGVANMDLLISAGILAAYTSSILTLMLGLSSELIFFEAVGSIVTFVLIGHLLEEIAVKKTTSAIEELSQLQPQELKRVTLAADGREEVQTVPLAELRLGDLIAINSGDRAPTDGVITRGSGSFDESMLTGEALPVDHREGEQIVGGTVLVSGSVLIRTTAIGDDTTLARIINLVREAQQRKPSIQRIGDAASAVFVPGVLAISAAVFGIGALFFDLSLAQALVRALAVVVVACPCAMGLATPTAIMVALGRAAKSGILIRGGDTLERLGQVRQIAFDKTGTLTLGTIKITRFRTHNGNDQLAARAIIIAMQKHSSHPIAQAIVRELNSAEVPAVKFTSVWEEKGIGIEAISDDGARYQCGGRNLASKINSQLFDDIMLLRDGVVIASLTIEDTIRPEAAGVIDRIKRLAYDVSMISGDTIERCRDVGTCVGIHDIHAQQLPDQKLAIVRNLQREKPLAYVGDGINDAPTLAEAAVGISLSSGSDIAIQSAQVLLTGGSIGALPSAIKLSRLTVTTIKQNLLWALIYNVIAVPLAIGGYLSPLAGALLMTFSDLVIVANSLRIKYRSIA